MLDYAFSRNPGVFVITSGYFSDDPRFSAYKLITVAQTKAPGWETYAEHMFVRKDLNPPPYPAPAAR